MKKLLLILLCSFALRVSAQVPAKTIVIAGMVADSVTNKPIGFATIALIDATTKKPVKSTLTKDDGTFKINGLAPKPYTISFICVGYQTKQQAVTGTDDFMANTRLAPSNSQLKEVAVTAVKPLMKQEVDRLSYDVQADPESKAITALDMMRKVPLLSVDASDEIKLRGSGSYKILLNGKESALMARSPSDILKAMPASNIVKIEVITSPPAKYEAEGLAGIINIITVKNGAQGYNGSVNSNYNTVNGYRFNLNTTVKQGKFGLNFFTGYQKRPEMAAPFDNTTSFTQSKTSLYQFGDRVNGNHNYYTNAELSYEIDTLNLIAGTVNYFDNAGIQGADQYTRLFNAANAPAAFYSDISNGNGGGKGIDAGINYQLGFKHNKNQLLTASYKYSNADNNQFNDVLTTQPGQANYRQYNSSGAKEYTTQLDYIHPLKVLTFEAGGKMILRNNFSNFNKDTLSNTGYHTDPKQTNNFTYHQNVYALYNSYTLKFTQWVVKGGLRFERTNIDANFATSAGGVFSQYYINVVPSISAQRVINNVSSVNFGFTQRIQRPNINQLNPFTNQANPLYISVGNPNLRPAVNNNFELSYGSSRKGSVNLSASYSFANNTIENVSSVSGNVTTQSFANVGKKKQLGLDANINYPFTNRLNVNVNAEVLHIWLEGAYNGQLYKNKGYQGHMFTYVGYRFDKGYRAGLNLDFDSRYVLLQGIDNYWLGGGANVSKDLFKGKGNIGIMIRNPFKRFIQLDYLTRTNDFTTMANNYMLFRMAGINFNYRFGKLNSEIKKNQRGINNDDTSGGGRN
ncbi:TonB-dependent receptor [Mucilaginibacter mali]|uniref:TonB-dependent receptor n=1 Tax=Mucilaginibacter mali TaxID=2740462 RepID=A0A7D4UL66_9SPHI|nr:outer membrane beta-barrel family protein [Mucilaginibacter mali]QKJ31562.1 TonB-dependent receptor [Mucilaginibacter mali]